MEITTGCPRETKEGGADGMQGQLDGSRVAWDARCAMPPSVAWRTAPSDFCSSCVEPTPCTAQRHEAATNYASITSAKWRFGRHQCSLNDQSKLPTRPDRFVARRMASDAAAASMQRVWASLFAKEPNFFTEEPEGVKGGGKSVGFLGVYCPSKRTQC